MKKILIITTLGLVLGLTASAENIHARERRQQFRIAEGVRSGELTRHEAQSLERREAALHREIRHDRMDGRGLTARERAKIDRQQDALSRAIYRQKHDSQFRH